MGFEQAVITFFKKYIDFSGRASRSEYWYIFVFCMGLGFMIGFAGTMMGASKTHIETVAGAMNILLLIPSIAVGVRRLHDVNKSGWWFLFAIIPVLGWLVLLFFYVQRGTIGDNQYGADPLSYIEQQ